MKKYRLTLIVCVLCLFAAAPAMADFSAGSASLGQTGTVGSIQYSNGRGGEFTISGTSLNVSAYVGTTSGITGSANSFQTFCLETKEYIASTVDIVVSTTWAGGGNDPQWNPGSEHFPQSHAINGKKASSGGDDLNPKTAYLYTQFARGILPGYTYATTPPSGLSRSETAGVLQRVIWAIEEEGGRPITGWTTPETTDFYGVKLDKVNEIALANFWYDTTLPSSWSGIGDVRVLNTWAVDHVGVSGYERQDQLYLTPVPGAFLLGMLGLGAAGIKLRKYA